MRAGDVSHIWRRRGVDAQGIMNEILNTGVQEDESTIDHVHNRCSDVLPA